MPTFAEELVLATMDEQGVLQPLEEGVFGSALAGAMLLELAFANRIDTDLGTLFVIDPSPTDDAAQDHVLARIAARAEPVDARWWIRELAGDAGALADAALAGLVRREVVAPPHRRFGEARLRRLEVVDAEPRREVANRLKATLRASDAPHPREAASVALLDACGLLANMLLAEDIRRERIEQLVSLDLIGREVSGAVADIERAIINAVRARAAKLRRLALFLSVTAGVAVAMTLLVPRTPIRRSFAPSFLERLWFDDHLLQWSGYLLLALTLAALAATRFLKARAGTAGRPWRLAHMALGLGCVVVLFAHTGFRLGVNLNALLMGCYLAALLCGALVGVCTAGAVPLRRVGIAGGSRQALLRLHVIALLPLPALLVAHILVAHLY